MDLRLFHPKDNPNRNFKMMDRLNSCSGLISCGFLESMGWYYTSLPTLLLGHYRIFNLHQQHRSGQENDTALVNGYILKRQTEFEIKNSLNAFIMLLYNIWDYPLPGKEIYIINQRLLNEQVTILQEFLTNADSGFEEALDHATSRIEAPSFLGLPGTSNTPSQNVLVQVKQDYNTNYYNTSYSHNELSIHPVIREDVPAKEPSVPPVDIIRGKEKDVFSKRQVLIFFDLLSQSTKIESFDLQSHNKYESFAQFFHAFTSKSKETWLEELKNYRNKDLYAYRDRSELEYLLNTLTNLSNALRAVGLKTLSNQAIKKIKELEAKK